MSDSNSAAHSIAGNAAATLLEQNHQLYITSQNIIEFWAVATRPIDVDGLGLVAATLTHSVTHLLTFNPNDFKAISEIVTVHPQSILEDEEDKAQT